MAVLSFDGVVFSYSERPVLQKVSFELAERELLVLLGPSGSGKSTVLRLAAGLEAPSAGRIGLGTDIASLDGRVVLQPARRRTSLVFQDLALWPHLTADEHLAFAGPALEPEERRALLRSVNLEAFACRPPARMSGGERQRLALARALASRPRLLLLDEPFANLDPGLRVELRSLLLDLHRHQGVSMLYVTHDLEDAFHLSDRIIVLNEGKVEQIGASEDLYRRPRTPFVATFLGNGTLVPGRARGATLETPCGTVPNPCPDLAVGAEVSVLFRPEDVEISEDGVCATVENLHFRGGTYLAGLQLGNCKLWAHSSERISPGETVKIRLRSGWPLERE